MIYGPVCLCVCVFIYRCMCLHVFVLQFFVDPIGWIDNNVLYCLCSDYVSIGILQTPSTIPQSQTTIIPELADLIKNLTNISAYLFICFVLLHFSLFHISLVFLQRLYLYLGRKLFMLEICSFPLSEWGGDIPNLRITQFEVGTFWFYALLLVAVIWYKTKERLFSDTLSCLLSCSFSFIKKQYILIAEKIEHKYKRKNENSPYTQLLEKNFVNYMLCCLLVLSQ